MTTEEHHHITQTGGTVRVHSNVKLDSVILKSPDQRTSRLIYQPSHNPPCPNSPCPAQLRAVLQGEEVRRLCHCSSRLMPVVTDLEYDAFISGQPPHSEQILVVCVRVQRQPLATPANQDLLEQLYERMNKNRAMPCTQCQLDSFRLVRYEMSTGTSCARQTGTTLLQHRHNASPGMFLMYIRGRLLFADYIFNGYSCSERNLHKQIAKTRADYRQGYSLPSDYRFSARLKRAVVGDLSLSQEPHITPLEGHLGETQTCERKPTQGPVTSLKKDTVSKAKKTATSLPFLTP
ncbi:uncharacterized protein C3orf20 homolog [Osmerus eperlanus]|uniref:uncharacterized protein C3orf20 homolog n=1 Tax=Osmerus eperlanus TaxID=29151 RepID=UPI002E12AEEC